MRYWLHSPHGKVLSLKGSFCYVSAAQMAQ